MACSTKIWAALRNMIINWPPLILFVACLITFSGVALILGAYVYNTEGIPDRDSLMLAPSATCDPTHCCLQSWNMFLDDMERHGFCPHSPPPATNATAAPRTAAAAASVLLPATGWTDVLSANGTLLQLEDPGAAGLNVSLEPVSVAGSQLLCVRLWGARSALPRSGQPPPPACDTAAAPTAAAAGSVELIQDGSGRCAGGATRYRLEYTAVPAWDLTLSLVDRERVYAHLSCTSAFLMVMAVCMLVCTLVRNRSRYTLAAGDKVPLSDG